MRSAFVRRYARLIEFGGIGLAAPQIGLSLKLFVMQVNLPRIVVNPIFSPADEETVKDFEGCLSFPGLRLKIKRHKRINVQYQNERGDTIIETLTGLESRCFQHEYDHIDGVCIDNRASKVDLRIAQSKIKSVI